VIAPRLLFVVNSDWFFLSHRLPLAIAARDAGADVTVVARDTGRAGVIRDQGLTFVNLPISRSGTNPLTDTRTFLFLVSLYRQLRPDLVHHVTVKPIVYGSLAARLVGGMAVINAISGLAYTFTSDRLHARVLRPLVAMLYRVALGDRFSRAIFQNPDDRDDCVRWRIVRPAQTVLIRGSGVDCATFKATPEPDGVPVVMLPARMLVEKGVREFVQAAGVLLASGQRARFVLVGDPDPGNPGSIPAMQLVEWTRQGIEHWGHHIDMASTLPRANIVVLPAYREGLPKVLLEAAACARAIVTTDVPGCREIVREGVNGFLVPARDSDGLANAIAKLLGSPDLRGQLGRAGRDIAVKEFAVEIVVEKTLALYRALLGDKWPVPVLPS
jgi:glycosyltransferase involved in cell wall biosynthesis